MNDRYDFGALQIETGWLAYYQLAHRPQRYYVTDNGDRVVFAVEQEAREAAQKRFISALNRSLIGGVISVVAADKPAAKAAAERLFRNGRIIPVERISA
jgi:hypothetical protein